MGYEARLAELGIQLHEASSMPRAGTSFRTWRRSGNLVYISGHGPNRGAQLDFVGKVGRELTEEEGYGAARAAAINLLATLKLATGSLDRVRRIVKVLGMVNCTEDFVRHPYVINGASDLFVEVFGDAGLHARSAVGMQSLPNGMPVEVEIIVEVDGSEPSEPSTVSVGIERGT
jgi:enamine deaminase RidA (YjgF/YER057c/UK114 family)